MRKTFKYRLYPSKVQIASLESQLDEARLLYNAALQERRDAWKHGIRINYYDQSNQLKDIRIDGNILLANFSGCQDILRRADKTFKAFFGRIKRGEKAGYPRFKSRNRFNSYTFPAWGDGCGFKEGRLRIQGIGLVKIKLHRPIDGRIKTLTINRSSGKWYAYFSVILEDIKQDQKTDSIGIDMGLLSFAALSNGELIGNPRCYKKGHRKLRIAQRKVSRRKKGSNGRRKSVKLLQKCHEHIRNQRSDFHHKVSRDIADKYGIIVIEDLNIKGLSKGMLSKSVNDASWGSFIEKLSYKVEETGGTIIKVNPKGTSQKCSQCGTIPKVSKSLSVRVHRCNHCGLILDRDVNAAINILGLGLSLVPSTCEDAHCVGTEAVCFS